MNNTLITPIAERPDWYRIEDDTVVTRDKAGNAVSLFGDDAWDIGAYAIGPRSTGLHFRGHLPDGVTRALSEATTRQWKQIMYFLMHEATDMVPASSTLQARSVYLREFAFFAAERQLTLYEGLSNVPIVLDYVAQAGMERKAQRLHSILVQLHRLGVGTTGLCVPLAQLHKPLLDRFAQRAEYAQYPVIPTRIYQHFLSTCEHDLGVAEDVADILSDYLARVYAGENPDVSAAVATNAVHFGCKDSPYVVSSLVASIRALCQLVILAFTGMRAREAENLPYDCLSETRLDGVTHYTIEGVTTKLSGGRPRRARWVTSPLAARAVRLAQRLSGEAHRAHGAPSYAESTDGSHLLFCRMGLRYGYVANRGASTLHLDVEAFRERVFPTITVEDIAELKRVDMHRAWEDEPKYAPGQQWPFTRHQLRRTLALYAHRSGLVTLPTLKRQLQHITQEMSMYYARGSAFAKGFIDIDRTHFAKEWVETQSLSEYLAYAQQVLFSDERLFGGHAAWTQSRAVQASPVSVYSRDQTVRMFRKGELAYRETVLGGCASIEPCKSTPLDWMRLDCLESNCRNLVVVPSKLQRVIKAQQVTVGKLRAVDDASVEYRIEVRTLQRLLDAQERLIKPEVT
ncbi:MAG: integrase [Paraburkholderia sp.]|jgi:integrase|uniref:Integrase family protein n=1 Tax=Paraburkholderia phytofirmans (strain DSM 17436 / LMG 22146 / PsJN) TaxID=398527 RepID=B2T0V5_PARPJ|nr:MULTISPECIES: integrase [Paraburkholderia]ACD14675.1 integrase family protein [Paraburkholderia phytofirmans PsJN]ACD20786.1 integrase family protein [Paraburkholderia phytofirmans PsJN]ACD21611.1 integrase family protein [Paraburkholderia phytofirmans PsJN]USX04918.1 integrase [Paraburkholderia fungorum]USX06644.1 integrase [Paraburkholderia fungorum]